MLGTKVTRPRLRRTEITSYHLEKYQLPPREVRNRPTSHHHHGCRRMGSHLIGVAEVSHKTTLPRKVWVSPGVSADVIKTSQIPWDMHSMQCGKYRTDGHMTWQSKNPAACIKCRGKEHLGVNCPCCELCSNYVHETAKCPSSEANGGKGCSGDQHQ